MPATNHFTANDYAAQFAALSGVSFRQHAEHSIQIQIKNEAAQAVLSLYGAQVLSYTPHGAHDLLWVSQKSYFADGQAIRGGIPLCWPWFGQAFAQAQENSSASAPDLPAHGFARLSHWQLTAVKQLNPRCTEVIFALHDSPATRAHWPHAFTLEYRVLIGEQLECRLRTHNTGAQAFTISQALHSYFSVDALHAEISGLEDTDFTSAMHQGRLREANPIHYSGEIDRIYHDTAATCVITDPSAKRHIIIEKQHSRSSVVWNPGPEIARAKADFGDQEYREMFCVESGNIDDDAVHLEAGASCDISATIKLATFP